MCSYNTRYLMTELNVELNFSYISDVLLDFSLTVIFISGCGSVISSAKEGKSGFIYDLLKKS